ncbi:protein phosphatase 1 regulatory subunit 37 isoform X1 [Ixodes scapularis]|uniref:protein phosphatase 1 regulatory subunit 37 isoform X1 n=1 Tax=Ixodes scapularis TaxID=6945 RepID=UPI001C391F56|nr:protein phosphatase 1 regulatory subunit 37 isoform X1 [Ixodes scapularis]XP_042144316.1 protein phosphatase 1 regulatory subunit 37 isoform X1 [Ixodes scapularis]
MSVFFASMDSASHDTRALSGYEKSSSAPTTPTETAKVTSHGGGSVSALKRRSKGHRVNFPTDDRIVTGYVEAPNPWSNALSKSEDLLEAYRTSCTKHGVEPLTRLLQQLQSITIFGDRTQDLNLKGERLDARHCEAMEDIFKVVQFDSISLEACHLDDEGAATVFDMIEYYESARRLNISHNRNIDSRGWQACSRMLKKTSCLQHLDARNTALSEQTLLILGRALRLGSHLHSLHLENCSLTGRSLVILVAALKLNPALKELYLGENGMGCADGLQLANLLRANSRLEYLDLRGNNLQDVGLSHLSDGMAQQPDQADVGLRTLVLWSNHISPAGMRHMSRALIATRSLITLNLGHNHVGDDGLHVLREALMRNKTLCNLGLQNTRITCEGAIALAEFIADSQKIARLDLRENDIGMGGLMALSQSLRLSKSVTRLDLDLVKTEKDEEEEEENDALQEHRKLLLEIGEQCRRNKRLLRMASLPSICNGISGPTAPTAAAANIPNSVGVAGAVGATPQRPPFHTSLSVNAVTGGSATPSSPGGSRFRVSRVCLEAESENGSDSASSLNRATVDIRGGDLVTFERSNSAPAAVPSRFTVTPVNGFGDAGGAKTTNDVAEVGENEANGNNNLESEVNHNGDEADEEEEDFVGHAVSKPVAIAACGGDAEEDVEESTEDRGSLEVPASSMLGRTSPPWFMYPSVSSAPLKNDVTTVTAGPERKRKISFKLPDGASEEDAEGGGRSCFSSKARNDRRMSTPAMPVSGVAARKKLTFKLCKRLESLDLRSTVPLSPTRLLEGWAFPEPSVDFKFPTE